MSDKYFAFLYGLFSLLFVGVLVVGRAEFYVMAYVVVYIICVVRTLMTPGRRKTRRFLTLAYTGIFAVQIVMIDTVLYSGTTDAVDVDIPEFIFRRVLGLVSLCLPMLVSRYVASVNYTHYYLPPLGENKVVGISELVDTAEEIKRTAEFLSETRKKLCVKTLIYLAQDVKRHDSFHYINSGSLSEDYFKRARDSFDDPNIYIAISKTGSPTGEFISIFTQKQYNHASISFDKKLQTIVSYNAGERIYPPGLNMELLNFFAKSPDSKIMVYSLACTREQKEKMLEHVERINKEGSSYNFFGLFVYKHKNKPNILYCSQFVYNLLKDVGLSYFVKDDGKISPTDLVELDYYRKLKFELEITFG